MAPREAWVTEIPFPGHGSIIVIRVNKGQAASEPVAHRLIAALLGSISLERLACHLAIIDGEIKDGAAIFGTTPEVEAFVRSMLAELARCPWRTVQLDWD